MIWGNTAEKPGDELLEGPIVSPYYRKLMEDLGHQID